MEQRIIKLTEGQLRDIVYKVINEQSELNELGIGGAYAAASSQNSNNSNISCVTFPSGKSSIDVKTKTGYSLKLFTNNRFINNSGGDVGNWTCSPTNKCDITFQFDKDIDPSGQISLKYTETMLNCGGISWVKQSGKFPLKYGEVGGNISKLQVALGMRGDSYFGPKTERAILTKAPEYKRNTGVTQEIYNKIVPNVVVGKDMNTTYDMNTDAGKSAYIQQAFKPSPQLFKNIQNVPQLTSQQQADMDRIASRPAYGTPTPPPPPPPPTPEDELRANPSVNNPY